MTTKRKPQLNGIHPHAAAKPHLSRWQRLTCKHTSAQPVYTSLDQEPGNFRAVLAHYYCHYCGRKLSNPHRRQRVNPLIPLFLIALAILITYWWWL